jgi:transposase
MRGHRYLLVAVDHDSGRLISAGVSRTKKTLEGFFDALGEQRCAWHPAGLRGRG